MNEKPPAKIAFISDSDKDCKALVEVLSSSGFAVDFQVINSLDKLQTLHAEKMLDLVVFWHQRKVCDEKKLAVTLKRMDHAPALILIADGVTTQDYMQAAQLGGRDVVNAAMPVHFNFVVRREYAELQIRRRLNEISVKMQENYVLDEAELEEPVEISGMGEMVETIDKALKQNQLELLFQPIMAVEDDGYDNFEIFLRIKKDDGYILPADFLPTAEQYGLMPAMDRWVVQNSIKRLRAEEQVRKIKKTNRALRFFLNLSGHSLVDEVIMRHIITELVAAKLSPGSFVIEVDRNTILSRLQKTKSLNQNVKKLKLGFAIDFYEESDNSLNYLKHIELDYLKLSHSVIHDIHKNKEKREVVKDIVKKARENNIKVVATQVENAVALPTLYDLNVDYIQGYVIAEPGPKLTTAVTDATIDGTIDGTMS